jgi:murein L,D-transpeptidase YafK
VKPISVARVGVAVGLVVVAALAFHRYGRTLWEPVMAKLTGSRSVEQRLAEIVAKHPELAGRRFSRVRLVCLKSERLVEVYDAGTLWKTFAMTAASGTLGPKLQEGDLQVPEGIYDVATLNPDSAYHLSIRVGYPNADDRKRSDARGISDYGGDIYIHGKAASIGCIAVGDEAIEAIFYAVATAGLASSRIVIAPTDPERPIAPLPDHPELYRTLASEIARIRHGE